MRKARSRDPELLRGPTGERFGYRVSLSGLPVAAENIFSDYDESRPATIKFRISNGNHLLLYFPEREACFMFPDTLHKPVRTTANFRAQFDCEVAFVPVLGPVEHDEPLYQKDAARLALISHRASRNFRFCTEDRIARELYWVGFGFQVWCQMLTFIIEGAGASLLAIDEPDIYLHSDLQRQLLSILKQAGPDILIATHSTELVSDADPNDIVVVTRRARSGRRLKDPTQLQTVFRALGSNLNPTLTQLAKTRRALFVEGKDFQVIAWFAERLGYQRVANRAHIAVVPADGFNPQKVTDVSAGIEATLGASILKAAVFDRDYRSDAEVAEVASELSSRCQMVRIHGRKEVENFLLVPSVLDRAVRARLADRKQRTGASKPLTHDIGEVLALLADDMRIAVQSQCIAHYVRYARTRRKGIDEATLTTEALSEFEARWADAEQRLRTVPGKDLFAKLNTFLLEQYDVSLSQGAVVRHFKADDVPREMQQLVQEIDSFGQAAMSDA